MKKNIPIVVISILAVAVFAATMTLTVQAAGASQSCSPKNPSVCADNCVGSGCANMQATTKPLNIVKRGALPAAKLDGDLANTALSTCKSNPGIIKNGHTICSG